MRTLNTFLLLGLLFVHSIYGQPLCSGCPSSNDLLKVATWNANLTPGSTQYPVERTVQAVRVINSDANADLLCLQEVYTMADQQGFIAGLNRTLPYSFTAPVASQNCSMSCTSDNIATLNNCTSNCMTFSGEEGENCMYQHCGAEFGGLPVACQVCLGISTNQTLSASMAGCTATSGMATTEGCNYLHGGSSGNMILSKYPFTASRFITFNTTDNIAAGALHVRIDYKGTPINFFCTSLLPSSTPSSSGTDMTQLNQMQTTELMDWINSGVSNNEPVIVAGSLSQGPATSTGSEGMNSANYNMWSAAGYQSALLNLTQGTLPCTLCSSSENSGFVTDHILVKMDSTPAPCISSAALFASRSTISTPSGSVPLSTHSGVTSSICYGTAQTSPQPTMSSSPVPTVMPSPSRVPTASASPVTVPVVAEPVSEGGIAMPAVVLAAVLIGINVLGNWLF